MPDKKLSEIQAVYWFCVFYLFFGSLAFLVVQVFVDLGFPWWLKAIKLLFVVAYVWKGSREGENA